MLTVAQVNLIDDPYVIAALIDARTAQWIADVEAYDPDIVDLDAKVRCEVEAALAERFRTLGPWTTMVHGGSGDIIVVAGGAAAARARFATEFGFAYDSDINRDSHGMIWELGDVPLLDEPAPSCGGSGSGSVTIWV